MAEENFIIKDNILIEYTGNEKNIIIPDKVKIIDDNAFWCCYDITSVTIPDSVTSIGEGAFYSCINLKYIHISDSTRHIGYETFAYCISLKDISLPDSITSIDRQSFRDSNITDMEVRGEKIHDPKGLIKKSDGSFKVKVQNKLNSLGIQIT